MIQTSDNINYYQGTTTDGNIYPQARPNVCPGCGKCRECGRPYEAQPVQPSWPYWWSGPTGVATQIGGLAGTTASTQLGNNI